MAKVVKMARKKGAKVPKPKGPKPDAKMPPQTYRIGGRVKSGKSC
jgi:hypothetical protein